MVVREACVATTGMLCLAVGAAMLAAACATSHMTSHADIRDARQPYPDTVSNATNIRVAFPLKRCVETMLARSSTFRQTYLTIAHQHGVRVTLDLTPSRRIPLRAATDVHSFAGGDRVAEIRLFTNRGIVELIAHEMEHVREQIEGTNLLLLSVSRSNEVRRVGLSFETQRGLETGLRVADEVGSMAARNCEGGGTGRHDQRAGALRRRLPRGEL